MSYCLFLCFYKIKLYVWCTLILAGLLLEKYQPYCGYCRVCRLPPILYDVVFIRQAPATVGGALLYSYIYHAALN